MSNLTFKKTTIDLGEITPGGTYTLNYPFVGSKDDIEDIIPSCGCTAEVQRLDHEIRAVYTDQNKIMNDNARKTLPVIDGMRVFTFIKYLTVYFKDGKPLKVENNNGILVHNKEKMQVVLGFQGHIKYPL